MAFSPWQILSPVQWAKWTWSAVRGSGAGEDEAGGPEGDPEEEEDSQAETKSLSFRQVHRIPASRDAGARHPSTAVLLCARNRGPGSAAFCPQPGPRCVPESSGCSVRPCAFRPLTPRLRCELSEPSPESAVSASPGLPGSLSLSVDTPTPGSKRRSHTG